MNFSSGVTKKATYGKSWPRLLCLNDTLLICARWRNSASPSAFPPCVSVHNTISKAAERTLYIFLSTAPENTRVTLPMQSSAGVSRTADGRGRITLQPNSTNPLLSSDLCRVVLSSGCAMWLRRRDGAAAHALGCCRRACG